MNRVDRLMAIVVQLQGRRVVRAEDLAAHFEISVRTVYRDLTALSEAGIPISAEAGVGYALVKGYHLPPVMFTAEEASALFIAGKLVDQLTDASLRKQMESSLLKIRSVLPRDRQDHLDRLERTTAIVSCGAEGAPRQSSETLIPLQRALAERRVVDVDYYGGQRRELTQRKVEPLGLIYYADNWHLIGHCRLRDEVRDFRTDRIRRLRVLEECFLGREDFSLKRYLERQAQDGEFDLAQIKFPAEAMERVRREWSWGLVEAQPEAEGVVQATMLIHSYRWMVGWLLSFGAEVEVLSPDRLREAVAGEAEKIAAKYLDAFLTVR